MKYFVAALLASSLVEKYSLNWHRRVLFFSMILFFISVLIFPEYLIYRLKKAKNRLNNV